MPEDFSFGIGVNVDDKDLKGAIDALEKLKAQAGEGIKAPHLDLSKDLEEAKKKQKEFLNPKTNLPESIQTAATGIDTMNKRMGKFGALAGAARSALPFAAIGTAAIAAGGKIASAAVDTSKDIDQLNKKVTALGLNFENVNNMGFVLSINGAEDGEQAALNVLSRIKQIKEQAEIGGGAYISMIQDVARAGGGDISQVFEGGGSNVGTLKRLSGFIDKLSGANKERVLSTLDLDPSTVNLLRLPVKEFDKLLKESKERTANGEQNEKLTEASAQLQDSFTRLDTEFEKFSSITLPPVMDGLGELAEGAADALSFFNRIAEENDSQTNITKEEKDKTKEMKKDLSPFQQDELERGLSELNSFRLVADYFEGGKDESKDESKKNVTHNHTHKVEVNVKATDSTETGQKVAQQIAAQIRAIEAIEDENPL